MERFFVYPTVKGDETFLLELLVDFSDYLVGRASTFANNGHDILDRVKKHFLPIRHFVTSFLG